MSEITSEYGFLCPHCGKLKNYVYRDSLIRETSVVYVDGRIAVKRKQINSRITFRCCGYEVYDKHPNYFDVRYIDVGVVIILEYIMDPILSFCFWRVSVEG